MLVKNIFMELRSRLRSCSVYITTGIDLTKNCNLKISIQSNCIVLNYYDDNQNEMMRRRDSLSSIESLSDCYSEDEPELVTTIPIDQFYFIIPNSMSCLKIERNTVSFRILTECNAGGNFYSEVLENKPPNFFNVSELNINVKVDDKVKFICTNCSNVISVNEVKFGRVLELPSSNMDMSEWFCHGHGHSHGHSHSDETNNPVNEDMLKPNKQDFLYRLTFFVINNNVLSEKTNNFNSKRNIYHCDRCLAWLGVKTKDAVKLFNSEVKIVNNNVESNAFTHKTSQDKISVVDFIYTIEKMAKEFNLGLQFNIMFKIVLECTMSATKKQYLLIWIIDKELQVLRNIPNNTESDHINLQSSYLTKILYKVELSLNDEVESWLTDPMVVTTDISKTMFIHGLDHLQKMSKNIPECFRTTNGYFVSYLKV